MEDNYIKTEAEKQYRFTTKNGKQVFLNSQDFEDNYEDIAARHGERLIAVKDGKGNVYDVPIKDYRNALNEGMKPYVLERRHYQKLNPPTVTPAPTKQDTSVLPETAAVRQAARQEQIAREVNAQKRIGEYEAATGKPATEEQKKAIADTVPTTEQAQAGYYYAPDIKAKASRDEAKDAFNEFYDQFVEPVRKAEEKKAHEAYRKEREGRDGGNAWAIAPGGHNSYAASAAVDQISMEKHLDPQKIADETLKRIDADKLSQYIMSRLGINPNAGGGKTTVSAAEKQMFKNAYGQMYQKVASEIQQRMYDDFAKRNMPKSQLEYILGSAFRNNLIGQISQGMLRLAAGSSGIRQQLIDKAYQDYGEKQSPVIRGIATGATLVADAPAFAVGGGAGTLMAKGITRGAVRQFAKKMVREGVGLTMERALPIAERYVMRYPAIEAVNSIVASGGTFAAYNAMSTLGSQFKTGEYDTGEVLKQTGEGFITGALLGTFSRALPRTDKFATLAGRTAVGLGNIGAEGAFFTALDALKNSGEYIDENGIKWDALGGKLIENVTMVGMLKAKGLRGAARRLRDAGRYDMAMRKEDWEALRRAGYEADVASAFFADLASNRNRMLTDEELPEDAKINDLTTLLQDKNIPQKTRAKIQYAILGSIPVMPVYGTTVDGKSVTTYAVDGTEIETRKFFTKGQAEAFARGMEPEIKANNLEVLVNAADFLEKQYGMTEGIITSKAADYIAEKYGVNIDEIVDKPHDKRTQREKNAVDDYMLKLLELEKVVTGEERTNKYEEAAKSGDRETAKDIRLLTDKAGREFEEKTGISPDDVDDATLLPEEQRRQVETYKEGKRQVEEAMQNAEQLDDETVAQIREDADAVEYKTAEGESGLIVTAKLNGKDVYVLEGDYRSEDGTVTVFDGEEMSVVLAKTLTDIQSNIKEEYVQYMMRRTAEERVEQVRSAGLDDFTAGTKVYVDESGLQGIITKNDGENVQFIAPDGTTRVVSIAEMQQLQDVYAQKAREAEAQKAQKKAELEANAEKTLQEYGVIPGNTVRLLHPEEGDIDATIKDYDKGNVVMDVNGQETTVPFDDYKAWADAAVSESRNENKAWRLINSDDNGKGGGGGQPPMGGAGALIKKEATKPTGAKKMAEIKLSNEVDENGRQFVVSSDGSTDFGEITAESKLTPAPIKLSLGENNKDEKGVNHGYGLLHIEAGHGEQIRKAGFASIEEFVETVAKNYDTIREGNLVADNQTYLLEVLDEHNNTLFIQLSKDGNYWNVNSAGIFREAYSRRKPVVASVPTIGNKSGTETVEVNRGHTKGATATSGNSSTTSVGKVTQGVGNEQGNTDVSEQKTPQERWKKEVDEMGEEYARKYVDSSIASLEEAIRKARKQEPKLGSTPEKIKEFLLNQRDKIAEMERQLEEFRQMKGVMNAGVLHVVNDVTPKKRESEYDIMKRMYADDEEVMEVLDNDDPQTVDEVIAQILYSGTKLMGRSEDVNGVHYNGYQAHSGYGQEEQKRLAYYIRTKENGGLSFEQFVEKVESQASEWGVNVAGTDVTSEVLSFFQQLNGSVKDYIHNKRVAQAQSLIEQREAAEEADARRYFFEDTHFTPEEYELWNEYMDAVTRERAEEFDSQELRDIFAEAYELIKQNDGKTNSIYEGVSEGQGVQQGSEGSVQVDEGEQAATGDTYQEGGADEGLQPAGEIGNGGVYEASDGTGTVGQAVAQAEQETDVNPTDGQKEAGNYKKGHVSIDGFDITIENPKGSVRSGKDASGKEWSVTMNNTYGYIRGTEGVDGDHIDVFLSDNLDGWDGTVYVVDQVNEDGSFDEHKVMYGFNSEEEAAQAYNSNYSEGWQGLGTITGVSLDEFKKWVNSSHRKTKPFAEYKTVDKEVEAKKVEETSGNESKADEKQKNVDNLHTSFYKQYKDFKKKHPDVRLLFRTGDFYEVLDEDATAASKILGLTVTQLSNIEGADGKALKMAGFPYHALDTYLPKLIRAGERVAIVDQLEDPKKKTTNKGDITEAASEGKPEEKQDIGLKSKGASPSPTVKKQSGGRSVSSGEKKIEDWGEKIAGARKDMLADIAKTLDNVTAQSLVQQPLSKAFKRPDLKKLTETGALTEKEALAAEAIMAALCPAQKPKAGTKEMKRAMRYYGRDLMAEWAEKAAEGIETLNRYLKAAPEEREKILEEITAEDTVQRAAETAETIRLRELNPDHDIPDVHAPNPVKFALDVLESIGYEPGQKIGELPKVEVQFGRLQLLNEKGGSLVSVNTVEEAREKAAFMVMLREGMPGLQIPVREIKIGARRREQSEEIVAWAVRYYRSSRLTDLAEERFDTREEAEKRLEELKTRKGRVKDAVIAEIHGYTPTDYTFYVRDEYTNEYIEPEGERGYKFATRDEAQAYLEEHYDEVNERLVARNAEMKNKQQEKQDSLYVAMTYGDKGRRYSIICKEPFMNKLPGIFGGWMPLKDFDTREEAEKYLAEHRDEVYAPIAEMKEKMKNFVYFGPDRPRVGEDWRGGRDVTEQELGETFGFRGVQFGNWTNDKDRQKAVNEAYDALKDLAHALGISDKAIGLNGELGIAFGARGTGSANAHYEPQEVVINLTKTRGAGSLAHEWLHALDNYFSRAGGDPAAMVTATKVTNGMRPELREAWNELMDAVHKSNYYTRSVKKGRQYWGTDWEVAARLFAEWINDKLEAEGKHNSFLSRGVDQTVFDDYLNYTYLMYETAQRRKRNWKGEPLEVMSKEEFAKTPAALGDMPYPTKEETKALAPLIEKLFGTMEEETRREGTVALYSRGMGEPGTEVETEIDKAATEFVMDAAERNRKVGVNTYVLTEEQTEMELARIEEARENASPFSRKQKRALETASVSSLEEHHHAVIPSAQGAKILEKLDNLANNLENLSTQRKGFLNDVAEALGARKHGSGSQYATFETKNGRTVTIRLSDHNARVSTFDNHGEEDGISIVVTPKKNEGAENDGQAHVVEYYYNVMKLRRAEGKPLAGIVRSIKQALYSGEYKDTTGLAERQELNGEDVARFSMRVYHGSGADFDRFDHSHMGEGEGAQAFGWGTYVTEVEGIGRTYAKAVTRKPVGSRPVMYKGENIKDVDQTGWSDAKKEVFRELVDLQTGQGKSAFNANDYLKMRLDVDVYQSERGLRRSQISEEAWTAAARYIESLTDDEYRKLIDNDEWRNLSGDLKYLKYAINENRDLGRGGILLICEQRVDEAKNNQKFYADRKKSAEEQLACLSEFSSTDFTRKEYEPIVYTVGIPEDNGRRYLDYNVEMEQQPNLLDAIGEGLEKRGWKRNGMTWSNDVHKVGFELASYKKGSQVYEALAKMMGSQKMASDFLRSVGIVGIKYPSQFLSGGREDGAKNYVIFDEDDLKIEDKVRMLRDSKGVVYGWTKGGAIYLTPKGVNPNTPVHEYAGHIWGPAVRKNNPELWKRFKDLAKESPIWEEILQEDAYSDIWGSDDLMAEEVIGRGSGRRNAEQMKQKMEEWVKSEPDLMKKAEKASLWHRLREALAGVKRWIAEHVFQMKPEQFETVDDVFDKAISDFYNEVELRSDAKRETGEDMVFRDGDEDVLYRIREDEPPTKTGKGYKVFVLKNGKLYPPMVANPGGEATPVGVWLDADAAPVIGTTKTGRQRVKAGGKGTQGGSGVLSYRPGWHLGEIPYAIQFNRINPETGEKELFPANFVWAEVEYANDVDYNDEAKSYGMTEKGSYKHSYAGLPRVPENGSYKYRTNPNPETDPWIITGAMKVKRILTPTEVDKLVRDAGREPQKRQEGAVSDEDVRRLNENLAGDMQREGSASSETAERSRRRTPAEERSAKAYAEREYRRGKQRAEGLIEKMGIADRATVYDSIDDVPGSKDFSTRKRRAKGWYEKKSGKIVIVMGNHRNAGDVVQTVLHEAVAHYGLRKLFGDNFNNFLDNVYKAGEQGIRDAIDRKAEALKEKAKNSDRTDEDWRRVATEEYMAELAENTDFEGVEERSGIADWFHKIKNLFLDMLHKLGIKGWEKTGPTISDNELRYILWRSYKNLTEPGRYENHFAMAEDVVMQNKLKVGEYAEEKAEDERAAEMPTSLQELKATHPGVMMIVRNGDFYELYGEDADKGERILGIDAVRRENGSALAGFPADKLDEYLPKLIQQGERVAFVDGLAEGNVKYSRASVPLTEEEKELRDALVENMKRNGIDVDMSEEGQRVIEQLNDFIREMRVFHGSAADFWRFNHAHMGEGEGAQAFGWGTYVTQVRGIAMSYAEAMQKEPKTIPLYRGRQYGKIKFESAEQATAVNDILYYLGQFGDLPPEEAFEMERRELGNRIALNKANAKKWSPGGELYTEYVNEHNGISTVIAEAKRYAEDYKWEAYTNEIILQELEKLKPEDFEVRREGGKYPILYTVEIPDNDGRNYLAWNERMSNQKWIIDALDDYFKENEVAGFRWKRSEEEGMIKLRGGSRTIVLRENQTGADLYGELEYAFGAKTASNILHNAGFVGIEYPAQYTTGGRKDGAKNYVIFNEDDLKITNKERLFRGKNGEVYGFVKDGKIYLDPRIASTETAVHEYGHLWAEALRKANPEAWKRLKDDLLSHEDVVEQVKKLYPELEGDELAEEVFTHFAGRRGAERLRAERNKAIKEEHTVMGKARIAVAFERLREALRRFWEAARDLFAGPNEKLSEYTAEDFADMMMADLMNGWKPGPGEGTMFSRRQYDPLSYNSGYTERENGTPLSERARQAESEGKFTEGTFRQKYGIARKSFDMLRDLGLLYTREWHHVGKNFAEKDFYEWRDHSRQDYGEENDGFFPEGSLAERYNENKKEIDALVKEAETSEWTNEPLLQKKGVPEYEQWKRSMLSTSYEDYLTEGEKKAREERHAFISSQSDVMSARDRYEEHSNVDDEYKAIASKRADEQMRREYNERYSETMRDDALVDAKNEEIRRRNAEKRGREAIIAEIAEKMGMSPEEAREKAEKLSDKRRAADEAKRREEIEQKWEAERQKVRDEARKRQDAYVRKLVKEGKAQFVERTEFRPEFFITEREEMNGRYGWFEANTMYNLPIYYSGIKFADKRSFNHYNKIMEDIRPVLDEMADKEYEEKYLNKERNDDDVLFSEGEGGKKKAEGETEDIWNDSTLSMSEKVVAARTRLALSNQADREAKNKFVREVGSNIAALHKAMSMQKKYDRATAKRVAELARSLMKGGYLNTLSQNEVKRLISAVKNSVGHLDIEKDVVKVLDIMIDNQLKRARHALQELEAIKGSKVDDRRIHVMGRLDPKGQHILDLFKEAREWQLTDIEQAMEDAQDKMTVQDPVVADKAALDFEALDIAKQYATDIASSIKAERDLREEMKDARQRVSERDGETEAFKDYIRALDQAIRQNKIDRTDAFWKFVDRLGGRMTESMKEATEWREKEKERIRNIQHMANSDMEGRKSNEHYTPDWKANAVNNPIFSFFTLPLVTFEQMLKMVGKHSSNGEGYLYSHFMRGWADARDKEIVGRYQKYAIIDAKIHEIFGDEIKNASDLMRKQGMQIKAVVRFMNGGKMQEYELGQDALAYLYAINKMAQGQLKLLNMGIGAETMRLVEAALDNRYKAFVDWAQEVFLPESRVEYNETHKKVFGAPMAQIEDYFPLKILATARVDKAEDLDNMQKNEGISTLTGAVRTRTNNVLAIDILNVGFVRVLLDNIAEMEHWNAFVAWNRDVNTLRTYKRFRNQMINMESAYGSGQKLWKLFNDVCQIAAGVYKPKAARGDKAAVNIAKGVTAAKVSLRMYTAFKQLASFPAFWGIARPDYLLKNICNPKGSWNWAMDNLPVFTERWRSRMIGDPRLMVTDKDWKVWRTKTAEIASRYGMKPNAFVDALTISVGARSVYDTQRAKYIKEGFDEAEADRKAKQDAEVAYNLSQQSSEGPFLSPIQVDRTWHSVLLSIFRNGPFSYGRQLYDATRMLKRNLSDKDTQITFETKKYVRQGIDEEKAEENARWKWNRDTKRAAINVAVFGFLLQLTWNAMGYGGYLLFGKSDDEKRKMIEEMLAHTAFGSLEGLTGGDIISQTGSMMLTGDWNAKNLSKEMPFTSDLSWAIEDIASGKYGEAMTDIVNLAVQAGIGVNPQSITDGVLAVMDACGGDMGLTREALLAVLRITQVPNSQTTKIYFDEVELMSNEVRNYTPRQLAERYARYKVKRGHMITPWTWGDEYAIQDNKVQAGQTIKDRAKGLTERVTDDEYEEISDTYKRLDKVVKLAFGQKDEDAMKAIGMISELQQDKSGWSQYLRFRDMDKTLDKLADYYLKSKSPQETVLRAEAIKTFKRGMVRIVAEKDAEKREELTEELKDKMADIKDKIMELREKEEE